MRSSTCTIVSSGKLFNAAKHKHQEQFQTSGKAINDKVRLYGRVGQALIEAKLLGADPFAAIESVLPWEAFASSVSEAQKLAQPEDFDFLYRIGESYATLHRYAPQFLKVLKLRAAPAAEGVLEAIGVLRRMNAENARKVPANAPADFIKKRWEKLVFTAQGMDRRYYELCAMSELKNALRSGDVWVEVRVSIRTSTNISCHPRSLLPSKLLESYLFPSPRAARSTCMIVCRGLSSSSKRFTPWPPRTNCPTRA
jgi:hypothetical protein